MWGRREGLNKWIIVKISKLTEWDVYLLHSNRWAYFNTITKEICIRMGRGMRHKKTEFPYGKNDSATPCCKINQQNVQFLHWVVTSFDFKYFVPKFKTAFINYSPQTSFVNNVLQICLIMLNVILNTEVITSILLFPTGVYLFLMLRKNDRNQW